MTRAKQIVAALCLMAIVAGAPPVRAANPQPTSGADAADTLFKAGKFADAQKLYNQIAARDQFSFSAPFHLGTIALLSNELDDAQKWLQQARKIRPFDGAVSLPLAQTYYRRGDFQKAAAFFRAAGKISQADTLASFQGVKPYDIQGPGDSTTLKFVATDPLPLVQVRINGSRDVYFFLDTGASEILLDADFARQLGIKQFGSEAGTFAGGKKTAVGHGKISSITLGNWTVKNVPVSIVNTRQHSQLFGGRQIDGIIGTSLLYHFTATFDYPEAKLVLRHKGAENLPTTASTDSVSVPFWMAGDHFLVAWGTLNHVDPMLMLIDTGSSSGAKLTETSLHQAGIKLSPGQATEGVGGAGKLESIPFKLKELSLGDATQQNVRGSYDGAFPWEHSFGFRLGGMIGHEFLKLYAVTFDFDGMRIVLQKPQKP